MIKLSNGYRLEFVAASGSLGLYGKGYWWEYPLKIIDKFDISLFTPITKTLTFKPEKGNCKYNYFNCVKLVKNGVLNAMGLPNPGIQRWIDNNSNFNGIVSIYPNNDYELRQILNQLNKIDIIGIELNVSCPNIQNNDNYVFDFEGYKIESLLRIAKGNTNLPIILKLSVTNRIENLFPSIEKYIDAISINSVPWKFIYPYNISPFESLGGGGLSGKIVQNYTWKFIEELIKRTKVPIIGCSVWDYDDIDKLYNIGCKAIGFGSIFLRYPWRPTTFVRRYKNRRNNI